MMYVTFAGKCLGDDHQWSGGRAAGNWEKKISKAILQEKKISKAILQEKKFKKAFPRKKI